MVADSSDDGPCSALEAALRYAERGWHVFPVAPHPQKKPISARGHLEATTDRQLITDWWNSRPDAQVGVACGASGICPVDRDVQPERGVDGVAAFALLQEEHGVHGCGLEMKTPRHHGGQLFYAMPDPPLRRQIGVRPGIDVLGEGGYTIVPSPASPGREWAAGDPFDAADLRPMPDWVLAITRQASRPEAGEDAATDFEQLLRGVAEGGRNNAIAQLAGRYLARGLPEAEVLLLLEPVAARCSPPYDMREVRRTVRSLAAREARRRSGPAGVELGGEFAEQPAAPAAPAEPLEFADWTAVEDLPPVEWRVDGLVPERSLVLLAGDQKVGKSFLALDLALRALHGMPFCGLPIRPCSVLYLCGEGHDGIAARLRAWRRHHRPDPAAAEDRYLVLTRQIPVMSRGTMGRFEDLVGRVAERKGHAPGIVVVDTLSQGLDGNENDSEVIAPVLRSLATVRDRFGCAVQLVHHVAKSGQPGGRGGRRAPITLDAVRGSGAITRNVDTVLGVQLDGRTRELVTLKQKDGAELPRLRLELQVVETGRRRRRGELERSCVFVPEVSAPELLESAKVDQEQAARRADALEQAARDTRVARVVAALEREGHAVGSINEIVELAGGNAWQMRTAVKLAISRGLIVRSGTAREPTFKTPGMPDSKQNGVCVSSPPHTPPGPSDFGPGRSSPRTGGGPVDLDGHPTDLGPGP